MADVQMAIEEIRNMNAQQLNQIVEAVKLQRTWLARTTVRALAIGDTVEFTARGQTVRGTIEKINRKTVIVKEQGYGRWKVAASLIKVLATA